MPFSNRLKAEDVLCRTPAAKTHLTQEHRERRLAWSAERANLGLDFWNRVVWSDEVTFRSDTNGTQHVWRTAGTR